MLLDRCEFDRNDYSLNVVSLPEIEENEDCLGEDLEVNTQHQPQSKLCSKKM